MVPPPTVTQPEEVFGSKGGDVLKSTPPNLSATPEILFTVASGLQLGGTPIDPDRQEQAAKPPWFLH